MIRKISIKFLESLIVPSDKQINLNCETEDRRSVKTSYRINEDQYNMVELLAHRGIKYDELLKKLDQNEV